MNQPLYHPTDELIKLLTLEQQPNQRFIGQSLALFGQRVFGGQILAQALMAAAQTCSHPVNSLHAYFIRPGDSNHPIEYEVTTLRDGQKFSLRQVSAYQHQQLIFTALISLSIEASPVNYQMQAPDLPASPDADLTSNQKPKRFHLQLHSVPQDQRAMRVEYAKTYTSLAELPYCYHQAIVAYYSDYSLLNVALNALNLYEHQEDLVSASLDHSLYFHRECRADEWMLYQLHCPSAHSGRGFNQGAIWQHGQLVCSSAQESLIRLIEK